MRPIFAPVDSMIDLAVNPGSDVPVTSHPAASANNSSKKSFIPGKPAIVNAATMIAIADITD